MNNTTKNNIKKILASEELVFCDLRQKHFRPNGIANFTPEIPIIIVKKKNGFNQPSNYYAIKTPDNNILTEGLGKKQFYDNLDNLRKKNQIVKIKIVKMKIKYWQLKY